MITEHSHFSTKLITVDELYIIIIIIFFINNVFRG